MKKVLLLTAVAALAACASTVHANEVFNQTLTAPDVTPSGPNAGFLYYGAGNLPTNFATNSATDGSFNISIGLRAAWAGSTGFTDIAGPGGTYTVQPGTQSGSLTHPTWDYVYSIDLGEGSANSLSNYTATLTIKNNVTGLTQTFNPLTDVSDNDKNSSNVYQGPADGLVQQNGESATFNIGGPNVYGGLNSLDSYTITLSLADKNNTSFALSDSINVVVAPLPSAATMGLGMLAVIGAAGILRKKLSVA